jgi:hypothetical protein
VHHTNRTRQSLGPAGLVIGLAACLILAATVRARPPQVDVLSRPPVASHRLTATPRDDAPARHTFRKEPYLIFTGDPDAMDVHWQLYAAAACTVAWGLDTHYSLGSVVTIEYGDDHQHACSISGLAPSTEYFYEVRSGGAARQGSFRSAPSPDDTRLKFFAYGDTRTYPATHDSVAAAMVAVYQEDPEFRTLVLHVGDLVENGDLEEHWDQQFFDPTYTNLAALHANLPTQSARGNHEREAILYAKYFPYPYVIGRAWSFDYGPAHFTMIDQYVDYFPGTAQLAWIEQDLATTDRPWKFVVLHEPGWSAGVHENNTAVQEYLQPIFMRHGVAMAFAGHNHYYARAIVDGVHHVTTGGGGAPLYAPSNQYPHLVSIAKAHHFCAVAIDGDSLAFVAVSVAGETLDVHPLPASGVSDKLLEPSALTLSAPAPSPSADGTSFAFTLAEPMRIDLAVYDVGGRLVRSILAEDLPAGTYRESWDGRSDAGEEVASGVYFVRLSGPRDSATRRVVRIR